MVKCANCGFLAIRNLESRDIVEVEEDFRQWGYPIGVTRIYPSQVEGTPFHIPDTQIHYIHDEIPLCFERVIDFRFLVVKCKDVNKDEKEETARCVRTIINEDKDCSKFTRWQQGFTPKEHMEMLDRQRKIDYEARRDADDKKWREKQEEKANQRHSEQIKLLQSIHKREMWIIGLAVTLALIIITIVGSAIEADWIPKWFGIGG